MNHFFSGCKHKGSRGKEKITDGLFILFRDKAICLSYLKELKQRQIRTFLISGIFRENQSFFKWYGGFYRKALDTFDYFFVQNSTSKELLLQLGKWNVTISGDTRFDRVISILEKDNTLDYVSQFKNNTLQTTAILLL